MCYLSHAACDVITEACYVIADLRPAARAHWPWPCRYPASTASERGNRLHTAISLAETIDEGKLEERKKEIADRRRRMEKVQQETSVSL